MFKVNKVIKWGLPHILWQILFFLIPLLFLFSLSLKTYSLGSPLPGYTFNNYKILLIDSPFIISIAKSLSLAVTVSILTTVLGLVSILGLWRISNNKIRNILVFTCSIVFFIGVIPRTFSLSLLLSEYGPFHYFLNQLHIPTMGIELYNINGLIIAYISIFVPLSLLFLFISRSKVSEDLIQSANEFGTNWVQNQLFVVIPLMSSAIKLSLILIFILTFADVTVIDLIGGSHIYTVSYMVIDYVKIDDWGMGAATAFLMLLIIIVFIAVFSKILSGEVKENV